MRRAVIPSAVLSLAAMVLFAVGSARAGGAEHLVPENGDNVIGLLATTVATREASCFEP